MAKRRLPKITVPARLSEAGRAGDDYGVPDSPDWRGIDWREHLRTAEIEGRRVNYVDLGSGDGPPVVFVHGIGSNWQNWLENLPRFARERRVVALDLPGFGASEDPVDAPTMTGFGRAVDALCERLGLGEVALVGNSMGGFVVAETAIRFPERVERLVLCSSAGITSSDLHEAAVMAWGRLVTMGGKRSPAEVRMAVLRPRLRHIVFSMAFRHPTRIPPDIIFEFCEGTGREAFMPTLRAIVGYDYRERLPEIRCPTLIVWGAKDAIVPPGDAYRYEELIPGTQPVVMMEDTGHLPMIERPRAFNRTVLEFLRGPTPEQGIGEDVREPVSA